MNKIIYIGGGKGGVGKSKMAFALVDYFTDKGPLLLVETDTANPDVFKAHADDNLVVPKQADLDTPEGWIELVNLCDEYKQYPVIINSAARNEKGIRNYCDTLKGSMDELCREMMIFWMINRQKDSLELLKSFMEYFKNTPLYVWRNLHFGEEEKFELYNSSNLKKQLESSGGVSKNFPGLADRVADKLYSGRRSVKIALKELPLGDKAELKRWRIRYFKDYSWD